MTSQYWLMTIMLSLIVIATRALPFLFSNLMSEHLNNVGKLLPGYIMLCLVIYELDPNSFTHAPFALPDLIGLLVVVLVYTTMHNVIVSLTLSFIVFLLCQYWLG